MHSRTNGKGLPLSRMIQFARARSSFQLSADYLVQAEGQKSWALHSGITVVDALFCRGTCLKQPPRQTTTYKRATWRGILNTLASEAAVRLSKPLRANIKHRRMKQAREKETPVPCTTLFSSHTHSHSRPARRLRRPSQRPPSPESSRAASYDVIPPGGSRRAPPAHNTAAGHKQVGPGQIALAGSGRPDRREAEGTGMMSRARKTEIRRWVKEPKQIIVGNTGYSSSVTRGGRAEATFSGTQDNSGGFRGSVSFRGKRCQYRLSRAPAKQIRCYSRTTRSQEESERIGVPGCSLSRMKRVASWYLHILMLCVYHHDKTACALQVLLYCDVNTVEYDDPRHKFGQAPHLRIDAATSTACTH